MPGKLYLAGPFHGDPFSVVSITSAVVGPFDLGTIVIRFGLQINPYTAQVSITPDRLRTDPHDHQRHRHPRAQHPRQHRPAKLHAEPNQLQPAANHQRADEQPQPVLDNVHDAAGHGLQRTRVQTQLQSLN